MGQDYRLRKTEYVGKAFLAVLRRFLSRGGYFIHLGGKIVLTGLKSGKIGYKQLNIIER